MFSDICFWNVWETEKFLSAQLVLLSSSFSLSSQFVLVSNFPFALKFLQFSSFQNFIWDWELLLFPKIAGKMVARPNSARILNFSECTNFFVFVHLFLTPKWSYYAASTVHSFLIKFNLLSEILTIEICIHISPM